jgi:hypothetical protein
VLFHAFRFQPLKLRMLKNRRRDGPTGPIISQIPSSGGSSKRRGNWRAPSITPSMLNASPLTR